MANILSALVQKQEADRRGRQAAIGGITNSLQMMGKQKDRKRLRELSSRLAKTDLSPEAIQKVAQEMGATMEELWTAMEPIKKFLQYKRDFKKESRTRTKFIDENGKVTFRNLTQDEIRAIEEERGGIPGGYAHESQYPINMGGQQPGQAQQPSPGGILGGLTQQAQPQAVNGGQPSLLDLGQKPTGALPQVLQEAQMAGTGNPLSIATARQGNQGGQQPPSLLEGISGPPQVAKPQRGNFAPTTPRGMEFALNQERLRKLKAPQKEKLTKGTAFTGKDGKRKVPFWNPDGTLAKTIDLGEVQTKEKAVKEFPSKSEKIKWVEKANEFGRKKGAEENKRRVERGDKLLTTAESRRLQKSEANQFHMDNYGTPMPGMKEPKQGGTESEAEELAAKYLGK